MPRLDPPIESATVMAERIYDVESLNSKKTLAIRIGFPVMKSDAHGNYFECQAEIGDGVDRTVRPMRGPDAFEAIFVAIKMIGVELTLFTDLGADRFTWMDGSEFGLRFPTDLSLDAMDGDPE